MKMKCRQCGAEVKEGAKYCKACGAKLDNQPETAGFCKVCGAPLKPGAAFCTACGAKVSAVPPQPPVQKAGSEQTGDLPGTSTAAPAGNAAPQQPAPKPAPKKKTYIPVIISVAVLLCVGMRLPWC